jgi:hypothetical protein
MRKTTDRTENMKLNEQAAVLSSASCRFVWLLVFGLDWIGDLIVM